MTSSSAVNAADAANIVPLRAPAQRDVVFIFNEGNFDELIYIQRYYPAGIVREWHDSAREGRMFLMAYLITKEQANTPVKINR